LFRNIRPITKFRGRYSERERGIESKKNRAFPTQQESVEGWDRALIDEFIAAKDFC